MRVEANVGSRARRLGIGLIGLAAATMLAGTTTVPLL